MELKLVYNEETEEWEQKKEPFITIEVETEEDFEFIGNAIAFYKKHLGEQEKPQTNADRIRVMSDEEFAKLLGHNSLCDQIQNKDRKWCESKQSCDDCLLEWLKQPAEENDCEN